MGPPDGAVVLSWSGPAGDAAGTDVVRFADDGQIELLVVFPGHVPQ